MSEPIRLSKRLAELLPCSRREAELYIENGWVSVAGQVVEEPQFKVQDEKIELHPDAVAATVEPVPCCTSPPATAAARVPIPCCSCWCRATSARTRQAAAR